MRRYKSLFDEGRFIAFAAAPKFKKGDQVTINGKPATVMTDSGKADKLQGEFAYKIKTKDGKTSVAMELQLKD